MIKIFTLKDLKIYRNKKLDLVVNNKDKMMHTAIFLMGDKKQNKSITRSDSLYLMNFKSYYVPKRVRLKTSSNTTKRVMVRQKDEYNDLKNTNKKINLMKAKITDYMGKNLFIDLSDQLSFLFSPTSKWVGKTRLDVLKNQIMNMITSSDYDEYTTKYVIIPFNKIEFNVSDYYKTSNITDILSALYQIIYLNLLSEDEKEKFRNITFIVMNEESKSFFKFNLLDLDRKSLNLLKRLTNTIYKLSKHEDLSEDEKSDVQDKIDNEKIQQKEALSDKIINTVKSNIGTSIKGKGLTGEEREIMNKIEEVVDDKIEQSPDGDAVDILDSIENSEDFNNYVEELANEKITARKNNISNARLAKIQKNYEDLKIDKKPLSDILKDVKDKQIEPREFKISSINKKVKASKLNDFEKSYNDKLMESDRFKAINSFTDENRSIPMYMQDYQCEDTSDAFNKKETMSFTLKDTNGKTHKIKLDIPKLINDRYLYLNDSKKMILKQLVLLPVTKMQSDTVQVTGNYRKMFLSRFGQKLNPKIERLKKFLPTINNKNIALKTGNCLTSNLSYLTTLDYDELAECFLDMVVDIDNKPYHFYFSQEKIREDVKKLSDQPKDTDIIPIGTHGTTILWLDTEKNIVLEDEISSNLDLVDYIIDKLIICDPKIESQLSNISVGKRYIYTRAAILSRNIPLAILLAYHEGIDMLLKKAKIKHEFTDKRRILTLQEKNKINMIPFKDGYLYYDMFPTRNSLLLNAFMDYDTKSHNYDEYNHKEVYLEMFYDMYGSMNVSKGFDNFIELFIDNITKEVLIDLKMPTDFTELLLYANSLLEDNSYTLENDMGLYRVRSNEIINAHLYELLADAYVQYKATGKPMSLPQDALIKKLLLSPLTEDYSTLNPVLEAEKLGTTTYKGLSGLIKVI